MKHIPILFSTDMVQAIIDGRKTQTRRTKGLEKINERPDKWHYVHMVIEDKDYLSARFHDTSDLISIPCPYGKIGDVLWVRESFQKRTDRALELGFDRYYYKAGWEGCTDGGWKPSIHMPKTACRIWLQITDIRVERVQDISKEDAQAEGVEMGFCYDTVLNKDLVTYKNYLTGKHIWMGAQLSFRTLWESINGEQSWKANPWVWVISFKQINKPENFC